MSKTIYRPVRDDVAASSVGLTSPAEHRNFVRAPVYVITDVMADLSDVVAFLTNYSRDQSISHFNKWSEDFKAPADRFFLEWHRVNPDLPTLKEVDVSVQVAKVKPDPGVAFEYEITVYYRHDRSWLMTDAIGTIVPGCVSVHHSKTPGIHCKIGRRPTVKDLWTSDPYHAHRIASNAFQYVYAFVHLLQARNVEANIVSYTPKQKREFARKTNGKKPPVYRTLTIKRPTFIKVESDEGETAETRTKRKLHHVRGHFRTYRAERYRPEQRGTFWISPHWRGDEKLGVIDSPVILKKQEIAA